MRRLFPIWIAVVLVASGLTAWASLPNQRPPVPGDARIVSGNDVGFRIEGSDPRTGTPVGTWVIKIDGKWVEAGGN